MEGLLAGFDDKTGKLRGKLRKLTEDIRREVRATTADPLQLQLGGAGVAGRQPVRIANITVQGAVDPVSTARQIRKLLESDASWHGRLVFTP
jgi:hypothetical protein